MALVVARRVVGAMIPRQELLDLGTDFGKGLGPLKRAASPCGVSAANEIVHFIKVCQGSGENGIGLVKYTRQRCSARLLNRPATAVSLTSIATWDCLLVSIACLS